MNWILHYTVLSLFCFYSLLLGTDAGTHGNLLSLGESTETKIPADILSEFYTGIDSQDDKYAEAIEKVKARKPYRKKSPKRINMNTENELTVGRRNLHKTLYSKSKNISKSKDSDNKNITKSKKRKNLRKSKKKNLFKRITPNVGENSPIDIIIHIKMREPKGKASIEAK